MTNNNEGWGLLERLELARETKRAFEGSWKDPGRMALLEADIFGLQRRVDVHAADELRQVREATEAVKAAIALTSITHTEYWQTTVSSRQPGGEGSTFIRPFDPRTALWREVSHPEVEWKRARVFRTLCRYSARAGVVPAEGAVEVRRHKAAYLIAEFAKAVEVFTYVDSLPLTEDYAYLIAGPVGNELGAFTFHPGEPISKGSCSILEYDGTMGEVDASALPAGTMAKAVIRE